MLDFVKNWSYRHGNGVQLRLEYLQVKATR